MSSPPESTQAPPVDEVVLSEESGAQEPKPSYRAQRRVWLPLILFVLTMLSTFAAGATGWMPHGYLDFSSESGGIAAINFRLAILQHWETGLVYMACLLLMLLAHEMGHFLMTLYYGVPASFPYFLPFPISPLGTLGAVIRMDNRDADRKQMFDIGIAGPLAGLVVAVPLLIVGIQQLDFERTVSAPRVPQGVVFDLGMPLASRGLLAYLQPPGYAGQGQISVLQVNPYFMAGWVGLLVTALNMMPVSQLDGGHITYCMFGRWAHWIARAFMVLAIAYMVYQGAYWMIIMLGLILLIGVDHPPTSNDRAPLGTLRYALGVASLAIPVLCLTLEPIIQR
jgi:membrane-associated protease RseP (regulator of RpoE activity)